VLGLLVLLLNLYALVVIVRIVMSWLPVRPGSAWEPVYSGVYAVTEPPLSAIRSVIPPVRLGAGALDVAPMILLLAIWILTALIGR
jgi:YggT family protein